MDKSTYDPPTLIKLNRAQKYGFFFQAATTQLSCDHSMITINSGDLLVRRSTVDGAIRIVVSSSLLQRILMVYLSHRLLNIHVNDVCTKHYVAAFIEPPMPTMTTTS